MKQIGFKNFRRFENFPAIDLAPITILVGENNAGKSTVVKGILALSDFLNGKRRDYPFIVREESVTKKKKATIEMLNNFKFYFNSSYFAHIGTFKRALCNKTSENDSTISFYTSIGPQNITIDVTGDKNSEEDVSGIVSRVCVEYLSVGIRLDYNLQKDLATVIFNPVNVSEDQLLFLSPKKRKKAKAFLAHDEKNNNIILPVENNNGKNEDKEKKNNDNINNDTVPDFSNKSVDEIVKYINDDKIVDKSSKVKRKKKSRKNKKAKKEEALAEQNKIEIEDSLVLKFKEDLAEEFIHAGAITKIKPVISDNWLKHISTYY